MVKYIILLIVLIAIAYILSYFFAHVMGVGWTMGKWFATKQIKKEKENGEKT